MESPPNDCLRQSNVSPTLIFALIDSSWLDIDVGESDGCHPDRRREIRRWSREIQSESTIDRNESLGTSCSCCPRISPNLHHLLKRIISRCMSQWWLKDKPNFIALWSIRTLQLPRMWPRWALPLLGCSTIPHWAFSLVLIEIFTNCQRWRNVWSA